MGNLPEMHMVGSVLIWAPPGRGRRVPGARNGPFWPQMNPGACFWGRKKPLREWGHATPRFSIKKHIFGAETPRGVFFGGGKSPCGKHADSHPGFGQGPVSNLTLKIKYLGKGSNLPLQSSGEILIINPRRSSNPVPPGCVVRVPTHWAI